MVFLFLQFLLLIRYGIFADTLRWLTTFNLFLFSNFISFPSSFFFTLPEFYFNSFSFYFLILFIFVLFYKYFYLYSEKNVEMNNILLGCVLVCILSANSSMEIKCHFLKTNSIISLLAALCVYIWCRTFYSLLSIWRVGKWKSIWMILVRVCVCMNLILIWFCCGVNNSSSVTHLHI